MRKLFAVLSVCVFLLFACARPNKELIIGTWQGTELQNAAIDNFFSLSQKVIDTMGKAHDAATNLALYGVANMDSLRQVFQLKHDSAYTAHINKVKNTMFRFLSNKTAYLIFGNNFQIDTAKWNFDDEGALVFEDLAAGSGNAMKRMQVMTLNDTALKLKISNGGDTSIITFRHVLN
jgi:hypothetical protein